MKSSVGAATMTAAASAATAAGSSAGTAAASAGGGRGRKKDVAPKDNGRRRITIQKIADDRRLRVTFSKRKNGLMKKAMELSVLCDCDVGLIVFSPDGRCIQYPRDEKLDRLLIRFANMEQAHEPMSIDDYFAAYGGGGGVGDPSAAAATAKSTGKKAAGSQAIRAEGPPRSIHPQANGLPALPTGASVIEQLVEDHVQQTGAHR